MAVGRGTGWIDAVDQPVPHQAPQYRCPVVAHRRHRPAGHHRAAARRAARRGGRGLVVGLVFLGDRATWSHYAGDNIAKLRTELSWRRPDLPTSLPTGYTTGRTDRSSPAGIPTLADDQFDEVLGIARRHGLDGRVRSPFPPTRAARSRSPRRVSRGGIQWTRSRSTRTMQVSAELPSSWSIPAKFHRLGHPIAYGNPVRLGQCLALLRTGRAAGRRDRSRRCLMWWRRGTGNHPGRSACAAWRTVARSASPASQAAFVTLMVRNHYCRRLVRPAVGDPAARVPDPRRGDRPTVATDQPHNRDQSRQRLPARR